MLSSSSCRNRDKMTKRSANPLHALCTFTIWVVRFQSARRLLLTRRLGVKLLRVDRCRGCAFPETSWTEERASLHALLQRADATMPLEFCILHANVQSTTSLDERRADMPRCNCLSTKRCRLQAAATECEWGGTPVSREERSPCRKGSTADPLSWVFETPTTVVKP